MKIIRFRNNFFIEVQNKVLFIRYKTLLTYDIIEPSFSDDGTEWYSRTYNYCFPTYNDAEKFLKYISNEKNKSR